LAEPAIYENVSTQFKETGNVSFRAAGAVTGKTFVSPSADRTGGPGLSSDLANLYVFSTCPAGERAAGVAKYDVTDGNEGGVHGQPGMIVPVTAGATIAAGEEVQVGPAGAAIPLAAGIAVGLAMSGAAAAADAEIKLY
jgi:hypothetical protein